MKGRILFGCLNFWFWDMFSQPRKIANNLQAWKTSLWATWIFNVILSCLEIQGDFKWSSPSQLGEYAIYQMVPLHYCTVYGLSVHAEKKAEKKQKDTRVFIKSCSQDFAFPIRIAAETYLGQLIHTFSYLSFCNIQTWFGLMIQGSLELIS